MTVQEFFKKNLKWITLGLLVLFLFKSAQSCTRSLNQRVKDKETTQTIDSLKKKIDILEGTNKELNFELKLQSEKAEAAEQRASAIQSVAEKIKSNTTTTVNVRGAEVDTSKHK